MQPSSALKYIFILLVITLLSAATIKAETNRTSELNIDALERQLKMGRHEQLTAQKTAPESVLAEFTTDGCSGGLSVGWEYLAGTIQRFQTMHGTRPAWESCCIKHDQAYHSGGAYGDTAARSFAARREADLELKACVLETETKRLPELSAEYNISAKEVDRLYTVISDLMYRAVRVGGMPCTGLPWRGGYGWPQCE